MWRKGTNLEDFIAGVMLGVGCGDALVASASALGLFLVGLGNGPLFPNFNYLTPQNFGEDASQSVMGTQMAAAYVGILAAPAVCGILGQCFGMGIFPAYLLAFFLVMIASTRKIKRILRVG